MKTYLVFLLLSFNLYSQDIDYLKSQDTVYIILKEVTSPIGKNTIEKRDKIELNTFVDKVFNNYYFTSLDTTYQTIVLKTRFHKDSLVKSKKKKFLNEKSNAITDVNFIDSLGLRRFF